MERCDSVSKNRSIDWEWVLIFLMMGGSVLGILYSFRFLFGAVVCLVLALWITPRTNRASRGREALDKVLEWENNGGPRPPEEVFERAADWFMYDIVINLRQEDMRTHRKHQVPAGVRRYLKSERELRR